MSCNDGQLLHSSSLVILMPSYPSTPTATWHLPQLCVTAWLMAVWCLGGKGFHPDAEDEGREDLPPEVVDQLHFGGFVRKQGAAEAGLAGTAVAEQRSKKEVAPLPRRMAGYECQLAPGLSAPAAVCMFRFPGLSISFSPCFAHSTVPFGKQVHVLAQVMEEVMAKSKAFRAAKQRQREEDLAETEALDSTFAALLQGGALAGLLKKKGAREAAREQPGAEGQRGDAAYDRLRRELVYEPKGQVRVALVVYDVLIS